MFFEVWETGWGARKSPDATDCCTVISEVGWGDEDSLSGRNPGRSNWHVYNLWVRSTATNLQWFIGFNWVKPGRFSAFASWHTPDKVLGLLLWQQRRGRRKEQWFDFCACMWALLTQLFLRLESGPKPRFWQGWHRQIECKIQLHQCEILLVCLRVQPFSFLLL